MDSNTSLALTAKGVEEVKHRTCKLSIRKRSVLLLLETPHRVDHLLQKTVLQPEEFAVEIEGMIQDGFIQVVGGAPAPTPAPAVAAVPSAAPKTEQPQYSSDPFAALAPPLPKAAPTAAAPAANVDQSAFSLLEDIILSEAKYLLVDFCVDSFGTRSQAFADEIGGCRSADSFAVCLNKVVTETRNHCPDRLAALTGVVKAINETA